MAPWRWGNVPLPEPHLGAIAAGVVLAFIMPWRLFSTPWLGHVLGWPVVLAGFALAVWAVRAAGEVGLQRPDRLVVRGPYALSRNPMYVGWTLLYVGIAFVLNSAWLLVLLPAVFVLTHLVIRGEERQLDALLGEAYSVYRSRVRRYL